MVQAAAVRSGVWVPKNTDPFVRMITVGRPINIYARGWRFKYVSVTETCLMTTLKALMTVRDLKAAYHFKLIRYSGCRSTTRYLIRWITNLCKNRLVARRTIQSGCGPGDCLGFCDKSLMAICVAGHVGWFACAQFGHKVSNTRLAVLTNAVVK